MNTPHPHKDLIIAWANGAQIQCKVPGQITNWADQTYPVWLSEFEYRIKPEEPKPKVKRWQWIIIPKSGLPFLSENFYSENEILETPHITIYSSKYRKALITEQEFDE